jgi:hypothetical protein
MLGRALLREIVEGSPDVDGFGVPPGVRPLNLDAHSDQLLINSYSLTRVERRNE